MKFLQCSDVHLESPFALLSPEKGEQRRDEMLAGFLDILAYATKENIPFLFLAGDLFESNYVAEETIEIIISAMEKAKPLRIFIAPGNHDFLEEKSPYLQAVFPENVHIFQHQQMEEVRIDVLNLSVWGCAGKPRPDDVSPLRGFQVRDKSRLNIGVAHGYVEGHFAVPYANISAEEMEKSGLDYLALGHVHTASEPGFCGASSYAYSGCTEGRAFDETGKKGFLCGEVTKTACKVEFVDAAKRHHHEIEVARQADETFENACKRVLADYPKDDLILLHLIGSCTKEEIPDPEKLKENHNFFYLQIIDDTELLGNEPAVLAVKEEEQKSARRKREVRKGLLLALDPHLCAESLEKMATQSDEEKRLLQETEEKKARVEQSKKRYDLCISSKENSNHAAVEENKEGVRLRFLEEVEKEILLLKENEQKLDAKLKRGEEKITPSDVAALRSLAKESQKEEKRNLWPSILFGFIAAVSILLGIFSGELLWFGLAVMSALCGLLMIFRRKTSPALRALTARCEKLSCHPNRAEEFAAFADRILKNLEEIQVKIKTLELAREEGFEFACELTKLNTENEWEKHDEFSLSKKELPAFAMDEWNSAARALADVESMRKSALFAVKLREINEKTVVKSS